jgi:hypothetical protein
MHVFLHTHTRMYAYTSVRIYYHIRF